MSRLGVHLSLASGIPHLLKEIQYLNINALQIFSGNPRSYRYSSTLNEERLSVLRKSLREMGIYPLIIHSPYVLNLGSLKEEVAVKSAYTLENELRTLEILDGSYLVFHAGSSRSPINEKRFLFLLEGLLDQIAPRISILLENCSGGQTSDISFLKTLIVRSGKSKNLGLCLDTCHLFAAGYDIRKMENVKRVFEEANGFIKLIHLNNSKAPAGSKIDRHEHLGKGLIGNIGLSQFLHYPAIKNIPVILETPKDHPQADNDNLKIARHILGIDSISVDILTN